jgi:hypothetical protein
VISDRIPVGLSGMTPAQSSISAGSYWKVIRPTNFKISDLDVAKPVLLHCRIAHDDEPYDIRIVAANEAVIDNMTYLLTYRLKFNHSGLLCVWI